MTDSTPLAGSDAPIPGEAHPADDGDDGASRSSERRQRRISLLSRLASAMKGRSASSPRDDLADALSEGTSNSAAFSPGERAMLENILRLRELRVEDVMVARAEVEAVDLSTSLGDLLELFERSGHSRMPVYAETLDDPRGMVHIRDVVAHLVRAARQRKRGSRKKEPTMPFDLANVDLVRPIGELGLTRPVLFVPPSMLASDVMARMQAAHIQMALVIDEYGGTDGLVSLEDVVEMVVGDIEDEHDEDEPTIRETGDGIYVVDGRADIDEVAEVIGNAFNVGEHGEDVDTIGGMIVNALGRLPVRGEVVQAVPGFELQVLDADPRRVKRVRIVQGRVGQRRPRAAARSEPG